MAKMGNPQMQEVAIGVIKEAVREARSGGVTAVRFLVDESGEWAQSRETWAGMAGLSSEAVRQSALRDEAIRTHAR